MDRSLDSIGSGYRLCILGDLNGWIGNRTRAGITSAFEVPGENDKVRSGGVMRKKGTLWWWWLGLGGLKARK